MKILQEMARAVTWYTLLSKLPQLDSLGERSDSFDITANSDLTCSRLPAQPSNKHFSTIYNSKPVNGHCHSQRVAARIWRNKNEGCMKGLRHSSKSLRQTIECGCFSSVNHKITYFHFQQPLPYAHHSLPRCNGMRLSEWRMRHLLCHL